ncbi:immunity 26/phosphotriesterase HocA family protein [Streptomyces sp. NBC_01336]|uniref:Imm26 family immunity protein n=1 Tax=Streptomyces sp. NBC_01336 TaxID=2903829 RepID=UPI002E155738|nr:immunity 26/phosphotriesterase HocA family protein [Streptomyces sp. NBC_01336]
MLGKYRNGDILSVPVNGQEIALAQVIEKLGGNVLLAVFSDLLNVEESRDIESIELDTPIFLVETMDIRIKDGAWPVVGNRQLVGGIPDLEYKVWVEPPGEYRIQDVRGNVGVSISSERASKMKLHKSFSPAVVESALRGFHGYGPWNQAFDDLTI